MKILALSEYLIKKNKIFLNPKAKYKISKYRMIFRTNKMTNLILHKQKKIIRLSILMSKKIYQQMLRYMKDKNKKKNQLLYWIKPNRSKICKIRQIIIYKISSYKILIKSKNQFNNQRNN